MYPNGLLLRRDVVDQGFEDKHLLRAVRAGEIVRIRQGAYADAAVWAALSDAGKHHLLTCAVVLQYDHVDAAVSHDSAVLRWNGPTHGLDLSRVHLTHLDAGGRRNGAGIVHHEGSVGLLDLSRREDAWVTSPARTVLDVAVRHGLETGVVVADDFMHRKLTTHDELVLHHERAKRWPGALVLTLVLAMATGKAESVGESLGYLLFRRLRVPRPEQQWKVFHPGGRLAAITDWVWHDFKVFAEFDGLAKYLRHRRPGETIEQCVIREKRREDMIRELTDYRCIRLDWKDLYAEERTGRRLHAVLQRRAS